MKKRIAKLTACTLTLAMGVTMFAGCGTKKGNGGKDDFSWLIDSWQETSMYQEYEDGPVQKYWMGQKWDAVGDGEGTALNIDFIAPAAGSEQDYVNTLLGTGEYPDVMSLGACSENATQLYEEGIALDITDYVKKYMPNYMAWIKDNDYYDYVTNEVDGERKFIQLYCVQDEESDMWGGYMYRRDWIVKYGKNPQTGENFTGSWNGDVWEDDVVFPSGNTDPIYISDWEWMFDIFETAMKEEGITDGYAMSNYYAGYFEPGDLTSGFGSGTSWYLDKDGKVSYGTTSETMRSYIECMNAWYEKGWMNPAFEENTDLWFQVDTNSVYSGKVGLWYGLESQLGDAMENKDADDYTKGIVVYGAPQPINDKYGDESTQNVEPTMYYSNGICATPTIITEKASEKDLATLFTAIDYLYSEEGALLRSYGFSNEQMEQLQDEQYKKWGLDQGAYIIEKDDEGNVRYKVQTMESGVESAAQMIRVVGMSANKNVDKGRSTTNEHSVKLWTMYPNTATIPETVTNQLSAEDTENGATISTNIRDFYSREIPNFITGRTDIYSDSDWKAFCEGIEAFHPEEYTDALNKIIGK